MDYIGEVALCDCNLSSVFIPPTCREIVGSAFASNKNLTIFNIPHTTALDHNAICQTKLLRNSPFEVNERGTYHEQTDDVHNWLKNMNNDDT